MIERTTFEDGDRFVIVYKNCDPELRARILIALANAEAGLSGQEMTVTQEENVPVYPVQDPVPEIPEFPTVQDIAEEKQPAPASDTFQKGPYKGLTPEEVLKEKGDVGFGNLAYLLKKEKNPGMQKRIRKALGAYFKSKFGKCDPYKFCRDWTEEQAEEFMKIFGTYLMTDADRKKVCDTAGVIDFDEYMAGADISIHRALIAAIIEKYK